MRSPWKQRWEMFKKEELGKHSTLWNYSKQRTITLVEEFIEIELLTLRKHLSQRCRTAGIRSCLPIVDLDNPEDICEICGYSHKYKNGDNAIYYDYGHVLKELELLRDKTK
jgi:hypothetical protein